MLELIIAMLVMLIVMSMAVTSVSALRHHSLVRGASDRYRAKHMLARSVAVRLGRTTRLRVETSARKVWIEVERSATKRDTIGDIEYLDSGIGFTSTRSILCFDARGLAKTTSPCEAADVTVAFSLAGRADTVRASTMGRIIR
jgi:hypothetical protein